MEELKSCPFCGGKAVLHVKDGVRVVCKECGASTMGYVDSYLQGKPQGTAVKRVIKKWNKRVGEVDDESN